MTDPDSGDAFAWGLSDSRFEIVGNTLKLKTGIMLDSDLDSPINLQVTATDMSGAGLAYTETFSIIVNDGNDAPYAIQLSGNSIQGSASGAIVGAVSASDVDLADTHTFTVNDSRFTVVAGFLKLKAGQRIDAQSEPTVTIEVTATDAGGLSYTQNFTLTVEAPVIIPVTPPTDPGRADEPGNETTEPDEPEPESEDDSNNDVDEGEGDAADVEGKASVPQGSAQPSGSETEASTDVLLVSVQSDSTKSSSEFVSESGVNAILQESYGDMSFSSSSNINTSSFDAESNAISRFGINNTSLTLSQAQYVLMTRPGVMWNELDKQLGTIESQIHGDLIVVGAAGAAASSFTVGVVAWGLRTGFLASGMLAQLPAWRAIDPLLIMQGAGDGDGESLEDLMKRRSEDLDKMDHVDAAKRGPQNQS
ncbi:hypothetical protein Pla22_51960 [Rubripirellula amarantea]|uniref:Cadherin domain-containing protein n=1 Tax=Rubripirellula amarantea TaxID=2527999 RepID=A0A5C5WDT9_9BACT|nr:hypothetical protein Pla22_51960 [Rubripirellula amarantea]